MPPTTKYSGLPEFGLELVTPEAAAFPVLVQRFPEYATLRRRYPDAPAAVLLNNSPKMIVATGHAWKYTSCRGDVTASRRSNLYSSVQLDILTGRTEINPVLPGFVLPRSARFISEGGMYGDNSDVLPSEWQEKKLDLPRGLEDDCLIFHHEGQSAKRITAVELLLDAVFFEDGSMVGPDESNLFEVVSRDIQEQITVAARIVQMLRAGESVEQARAVLDPLSRKGWDMGGHPTRLVSSFAKDALDRLASAPASDSLAWFERLAQPPRIALHRPVPPDPSRS